jgi:hypothetical protein
MFSFNLSDKQAAALSCHDYENLSSCFHITHLLVFLAVIIMAFYNKVRDLVLVRCKDGGRASKLIKIY